MIFLIINQTIPWKIQIIFENVLFRKFFLHILFYTYTTIFFVNIYVYQLLINDPTVYLLILNS